MYSKLRLVPFSIWAWIAVMLAASPGMAGNGTIGIFANPEGTLTSANVDCGDSITLYVYAFLDGATAGGVTGAEYSVAVGPVSLSPSGTSEDLAPDGLFVIEIPAGATTVHLGQAFNPPDPDPRGTNLVYATCQTGDGTKVLLETVQLFNLSCAAGETPHEIRLRVIRHDTPSNLLFQCPLVTLCDDPLFTRVCMGDPPIDCTTPFPPFPPASSCSLAGEFVLNEEPMLIVLESFAAEIVDGNVRLRWVTASETDNAGFRVLRVRASGYKPSRSGENEPPFDLEVVTPTHIPAMGNELYGAEYEVLDTIPQKSGTVFYYLEDIDTFGRVTRHGPVAVEIPRATK